MLADIARDAGLPDGAFNVVQGIGEEAGAALVAHPDVDRIAFTGSVDDRASSSPRRPAPTSRRSRSSSAASRRSSIFADADLDAAVKQAVNQFDNAGQVCLAGTRLLVERAIHDEFLDTVHRGGRRDTAGRSPRDDTTDIGPQITREHLDRVDGFVQRAKAEGATSCSAAGRTRSSVASTTGRRSSSSYRAAPRSCSTRCSAGAHDAAVRPTRRRRVALANDTTYGLAAIVYTGDRERAERVSRARSWPAPCGSTASSSATSRAPFGGSRDSGHRPRGWHLELRLLFRRQERLHRTVELN